MSQNALYVKLIDDSRCLKIEQYIGSWLVIDSEGDIVSKNTELAMFRTLKEAKEYSKKTLYKKYHKLSA